MTDKDVKIYIIGAGVSGLAAAITLKNAGYNAQILEHSPTVGGRVKTTKNGSMKLDHGFQVLLDEYPAAKEFLNLESLNLVKFSPASIVFIDGNKHIIGDAQRDMSFAWNTLIAGVGIVSDKWKVFYAFAKAKTEKFNRYF